MLTAPVVEQCPYTVAGQGVIKIAHPVLATLAGAVFDNIEWLALLVGTRSENGLEISVTDMRIPLQERGQADCSLFGKPQELDPDVVGVVHSHHSMAAFFSYVDKNTLNPRFPMSLVVAQPRTQESEVESLLGFNYRAEGRVPLPCGSIGIVNFTVVPDPLVEMWPEKPSVGFSEPQLSIPLSDCPHVTRTREVMQQHCSTKCGLITIGKATSIFGRDAKSFLKEVESKTRGRKFNNSLVQYGPPVVNDNRRYFNRYGNHQSQWDQTEAFIKHWSEWGD